VAEVLSQLQRSGRCAAGNRQDRQPTLRWWNAAAVARTSEAFDDVQGSFFSSGVAEEAIILGDFGRDLLNLPREPRGTDVKLTAEQADQLLGKYIVLRYHKREPARVRRWPANPRRKARLIRMMWDSSDGIKAEDAQSFNLVPKQLKLKIVGIVSSEPNRGFRQGRTPCFCRWRWQSRWTCAGRRVVEHAASF